MTSGRFALPSAAFLTAVLTITTLGCGNGASPCTDCPVIEGKYRLDFGDAGAPAACTQQGVSLPDGELLNIAQEEGRIRGTVLGVPLQGSVATQGTFSMSGTRAPTAGGVGGSLSLAGSYSPPREDGGTARLTGTFVGNLAPQGASDAQRCNLNSPFSATRE